MNEVPSQWGVERVCSWLEHNGLGHLCGVFRKNKIDGSNLLQLTKADLKDELEIQALGDRKAVLEGIDRLRASRASPVHVPPSLTPSLSPSSRASVSPSGLGTTDCCEHCFKPFLLNEKPILLTLPGASRAATLHLRCKENWAWQHAKQCKQCLKPMTQHITTVSGVGFKAELHPECVSAFERSRGVTSSPSSSPPPPRTSSPLVDTCAHCLSRFSSLDAPILYSLPGETRTVELHPHCKEHWAASHARKCDHCFVPMTKEVITLSGAWGSAVVHPECKDRYSFDRERKSPLRSPRSISSVSVPSVDHCAHCLMRFTSYDNPILFSLPGESSSVEIHPHCKSGWAERHARRCDECHNPLTHESITLTGAFGTAHVHPECRELFSLRKSASPPAPVRSSSPLSDHCAHCLSRFTSFDSPIIFTLPGETKSVELHPHCRDAWASRHAKRCDECGSPIPKEVITLKGSWGVSHVHPECQDRFTQKKGAVVSPRLSPRSGSPIRPAATCAKCLKSFTSYDTPIIYSLPGEITSHELHPHCKEGWINLHAKRCDECSDPLAKEIVTLKGSWGSAHVHPECKDRFQLRKSVSVSPRSGGGSPIGGSCEHCFKGFTSYDVPVLLTLPGASRAAELHEHCKHAWSRRHSKLCDHCREPMIDSITTLSGTFGTVELHKGCVTAFERVNNIKASTGTSSPTPVVTDRCSYCHVLFKDGELTSVVSLPGSTAAGKLHPNCVDSWSKLHAKLCDHCSKPMPVDVTTLSGVWGTAEVHPECVSLFKDNVHRRGYSSSPARSTSPVKVRSAHICAECNSSISSSEVASIISFPELGNTDTHLHDRCIDSFRRRIGRVCTWCDGTITGQLTEIKGDFGSATLHPSCLLPFKKAKGIF
eukprot:TRINITY_DN13547_c0_g1_i1.p1 TRINITY_DN13547_c0_g1~~TRINITY_DN13547_c0_g1_i1.p1  ORF type:complete len:895 (+),score=125.85 TRINITY_DN13547_c0_g1_i1:41-2686(+)